MLEEDSFGRNKALNICFDLFCSRRCSLFVAQSVRLFLPGTSWLLLNFGKLWQLMLGLRMVGITFVVVNNKVAVGSWALLIIGWISGPGGA